MTAGWIVPTSFNGYKQYDCHPSNGVPGALVIFRRVSY